ncbi:MAG: hypothetical protein AAF390_15995, partial [Pseudomonadota bacterium]
LTPRGPVLLRVGPARPHLMGMFARIVLLLVAVLGWAVVGFGAWIAWRGAWIYAGDPVLMGTGGGLAAGGLLVGALTVGAWAQLSTARDTAAMRAMMEASGMAEAPPAPTPTA